MRQTVVFPSGSVDYIFQSSVEELLKGYEKGMAVIITNEHLFKLYPHLFKQHKTLVLPPVESSKDLRTIDSLAKQLLEAEATRKTTLIGIGGGVITDITGFLASVYMRGVSFGFVPTTLLGMVDAAIGGKNGVNLGFNKNILGTINQPDFILYDMAFLQSLPNVEWSNGFAEIIKYACIFDADLFTLLEGKNISHYKNDVADLISLVDRCAAWKNKTVIADEHETGERKLLNFGHTAAHAIENLYELPHGKAVAIGMVIAAMLSEKISGLKTEDTHRLKELLELYNLPVHQKVNTYKAMEILKMDKKRNNENVDYIVLEAIGRAAIRSLPLTIIETVFTDYESHN